MGNYSIFMGCPSGEAATREDHSGQYWDEDFLPALQNGWGPALCSKYAVPLLWVACFAREDEILVERRLVMTEEQTRVARSVGIDVENNDTSFVGLWTSASIARARIIERKHGILEAIPTPLRPSYGDLIDAWADHLEAHFTQGVFLDGDDVFGMSGHDTSAEALRALLDALARMDKSEAPLLSSDIQLLSPLPTFQFLRPKDTPDEAARQWRGQFAGSALQESILWPPEPTADELAFAETLPRTDWREQQDSHKYASQKPWWKFW